MRGRHYHVCPAFRIKIRSPSRGKRLHSTRPGVVGKAGMVVSLPSPLERTGRISWPLALLGKSSTPVVGPSWSPFPKRGELNRLKGTQIPAVLCQGPHPHPARMSPSRSSQPMVAMSTPRHPMFRRLETSSRAICTHSSALSGAFRIRVMSSSGIRTCSRC